MSLYSLDHAAEFFRRKKDKEYLFLSALASVWMFPNRELMKKKKKTNCSETKLNKAEIQINTLQQFFMFKIMNFFTCSFTMNWKMMRERK
ncbi:hypothetical protein Lalb_Chr12g0201831 [Lupinus albus]|uniref:Uncharacterized protein n=1 Tax=Lupinus albus TaxID=3870 RepID=A0A6A4PM98_LUPAL|nr:hypothetical protein Lalb_Chr12g0201831 [Lupinus albus]